MECPASHGPSEKTHPVYSSNFLFCFVWASPSVSVFDPVAASGDGDGDGVMEEAVQDGAGGGHVAEELAPVFQRPVAGHDGGAVFVAAHHHFQQIFAGLFGQCFEPHVVDDDQVGLQDSGAGSCPVA